MRKTLAAPLAAVSLCTFAAGAQAQSSVTIYGIVDSGISYVSNSGGHSAWIFDTGVPQGNRLGFTGTEDLGGGMKALFRLENGFNLNNGQDSENGTMFNRQAFVGLKSDQYGALTLERVRHFV